MAPQGNVKSHGFQKQVWRPFISLFYFDCMPEIRKSK